jgi:hypothetical protein
VANASRLGALFVSGTVGTIPDAVYVLTLCRGDTANATACGSCVATVFQGTQQLCAYDKDAAVFYDSCYLRYSNGDFLASTTGNGNPIVLINSRNVSSLTRAFDAAVAALLNATRDYSTTNSSRLFAMGVEVFVASDPTIYGLTQCTPGMSPAVYRTCLGGIISSMLRYLSGRQGGRITSPGR